MSDAEGESHGGIRLKPARKLRRHNQDLAFRRLLEITRSLVLCRDPQELFQKVIDAAVEVTGAERGYLLLMGDSTTGRVDGLRVVASCRLKRDELETAQFRASRSAITMALRSGETVNWSAFAGQLASSHSMERLGLKSIICAPLKFEGRVFGVLYLDSQFLNQFSVSHEELLPSFAAQAAVAIENARLQMEREASLKREYEEQARALQLETYKESLTSFLAIASHDLKSPLTVMKTAAAVLRRDLDPETRREVTEHLDRAVEKASRLVSGYLDVQQLEAGKGLDLRHEMVPLRELIEAECSLALGGLEEGRRKRFSVRIDVPETATIWADRNRLTQILTNLIDNAIKYSPNGGELGFGYMRGLSTDELMVSDCGLGIPAQEQSELFSQFHRLRRDSAVRGTGLGLFSVRRLVEAHLATISVQSEEGRGTTFLMSFPRPTAKGAS